MLTEIGSNFWEYNSSLVADNIFFWNSTRFNKLFLKSGRNAIKALCKNIKTDNKKVLLPNYTCETVIQPFVDEGWSISFYKINKNLSIDKNSLLMMYQKEQPKVILLHTFFGFNTKNDFSVLNYCKDNGAIIVEDMTQSLFSNHHIDIADYYVTSLRKFLAIPDGGVLITTNKLIPLKIDKADENIKKIALEAFNLKKEYFANVNIYLKEKFREKYQELNDLISGNNALRSINDISLNIFSSCDASFIRNSRFNNYSIIYDSLKTCTWIKPVLPKIVDGVCPLYFPIYVEKRKELQTFLAQHSIYCPVIWPKPKQITDIDEETEYMYEHMLCIPIDQRYGFEEMNKIIDVMKEYEIMENDING